MRFVNRIGLTLLALLLARAAAAQERAYFVTYDHYLEEPGSFEIGVASTVGVPRDGRNTYTAPWLEFEYGVKGWWTTELYLEGVTTGTAGSGVSGWRFENRFRPLKSEHRINPVLYLEYESLTEASRIQKEIVGAGALDGEPISVLLTEPAREIEGKLILSSTARNWNVATNLIFEKNLSVDEGVEFGYAVGVSRRAGDIASGAECRLCAENFVVGIELYGGLGSTQGVVVQEARHFVAPTVAWRVSDRSTVKVSASVGLTQVSDPLLLRVGWTYELPMRRRP